MYLITYMTIDTPYSAFGVPPKEPRQCYAYALHTDPAQFIIDCQQYPETYYLINAVKLSDAQYRYIKENDIKGM
jgi:hypothetical protein